MSAAAGRSQTSLSTTDVGRLAPAPAEEDTERGVGGELREGKGSGGWRVEAEELGAGGEETAAFFSPRPLLHGVRGGAVGSGGQPSFVIFLSALYHLRDRPGRRAKYLNKKIIGIGHDRSAGQSKHTTASRYYRAGRAHTPMARKSEHLLMWPERAKRRNVEIQICELSGPNV